MEIIYNGWPKDNEVLLDEITCKYIQENDCTERKEDGQEIILSTRDGGGGKFINIKTENWSISDENDISNLIKHFRKIYENINNT